MKQTFFTLILVTLSVLSFAQGDIPKYVITISDFKTQEFEVFNRNDKIKITKKIVKQSYIIAIKDNITINSFEVLNEEGNYTSYPADNPSKLTGFTTYILSDSYTGGDKNEILIKIKQGIDEVVITLKVESSSNGSQEQEHAKKTPCELFKTNTKNSDCNTDKEFFGESVDLYNENTIVYVYDFNKDPSKRVFYKITKNKKSSDPDPLLQIELESKEAIRDKVKTEFDKDKTNIPNKVAFQKAQKDVDNTKASLENSKFGLNKEIINFNKETLTPGKNVRFKIYNVNKFMYDVSIADTVVEYDSEPPLLFARFFLGDSTSLGSLMDAYSSEVNAKSYSKEDFKSLSNKLSCFVNEYNRLQDEVLKAYDPCNEFVCCHSVNYLALANYLASIRLDATKIQQELEEQKNLIAKCDKSKKATADNPKLEAEIKELKKDEAKNKKDIEAKEKELKKINDDLKSDCGDNDKIKKDAEAVLAEFTAINQLLERLPKDEELKRIIVFLNNVVQQNNIHTSDYISLNGNLLELTLSITSKDSIHKYFSIPEYKNQTHIQIPILWKPFVSFSSGTFLAFGSDLQNKTYEWQEIVGTNNTADPSKYTLVESGYAIQPLGFSALGNVGVKFSRSLGFGGSAGVGLSIEKTPRLAYLFGGSFYIGDLRQFTITLGIAGMQVDKLTNNFQTITDNQIIYTSKSDIQHYKEFKVGGFLSLTYTPFKVFKTKTAKSKDK